MDIKINTPIEVTYKQLYECRKNLAGVIAFQDEELRSDGHFFVKLLMMEYASELAYILKFNN